MNVLRKFKKQFQNVFNLKLFRRIVNKLKNQLSTVRQYTNRSFQYLNISALVLFHNE